MGTALLDIARRQVTERNPKLDKKGRVPTLCGRQLHLLINVDDVCVSSWFV